MAEEDTSLLSFIRRTTAELNQKHQEGVANAQKDVTGDESTVDACGESGDNEKVKDSTHGFVIKRKRPFVSTGDGEHPPPKKIKKKKARAIRDGTAHNPTKDELIAVFGYGARPDVTIKEEEIKNRGYGSLPLKIVQEVVPWAFDIGKSPWWVFVKNRALVQDVVLASAEGLSWSEFEQYKESGDTPFLSSKHVSHFPTLANGAGSGTSRLYPPHSAILLHPMKKGGINVQGSTKPNQEEEGCNLESLVMTSTQLRENHYPREGDSGTEDFFKTTDHENGLDVVAIDCEMCRTTVGLELTRVVMVNRKCELLYDKLCLPDNPIEDYVSRWSGITPDMMEGVETKLADVQTDLLKMVSSNTVIVGHSGENDLRALKIIHNRIVDTALIYPHPRGPPCKNALKTIAWKHLNKEIQKDNHECSEDAVTAMELFNMKMEKGLSFGVPKKNTLPLSELLELKTGSRTSLIDGDYNLKMFAGTADARLVLEDEQAEKEVLQLSRKSDRNDAKRLLCVGFNDLINACFRVAKEGRSISSEEKSKLVRELDARLARLDSALAPSTLVVVYTGNGDRHRLKQLYDRKLHAKEGEWESWMDDQLAEMTVAVSSGVVFTWVTTGEPREEEEESDEKKGNSHTDNDEQSGE